jgi:CRP/FNR family transcriptional regulator, polysaccharide utilization system transcription regulator
MQYANPYIELCLEGSASIFKGLNQKDKEVIAERHTLVNIKKGGFIFKEGEKSRGLVNLVSGKVKVFKVGVGGREQIIRMVAQQEYVGYGSLFSENIWSFSTSAIEDSVVCILEKHSLSRILKKNPDLAFKLTRILTEEVNSMNNRIISLTQKHVRGRLVESLLMLRDTYGYESDGKTLQVSISRDDIAHFSNMTTSNAIRTLSNLASEGIIKIKGRKITILNYNVLKSISEQG